MSIESLLERIAVALEKIAATADVITVEETPVVEPAPKAKKAKKDDAVNPMEVLENLDKKVEEAVEPQVTITVEALTLKLREHANTIGAQFTQAIMLKHGANKNTPKISTIPLANYEACYKEAEAELKKVKK